MAAPVMVVQYRIGKGGWSKKEPVDLALRNDYRLPEPSGEFYGSIEFDITIRSGLEFKLQTTSGSVERCNRNQYRLVIEQDAGGTAGLRRLDWELSATGEQYLIHVTLPIVPEHLELDQFHTMLDDISHWLFFSLASSVKLDIGYTDRFTQAVRAQQALLGLIEKRLSEVEEILHIIAGDPRRKINKEYYLTNSQDRLPEDAVTQRWKAQNLIDNRALTFRNVVSTDVYENRFILFFLSQLERRLAFLQHIAERTLQELANQIREKTKYQDSDAIENLNLQKREAEDFRKRCVELQEVIHRLRNLDFLRGIVFSPADFRLIYSLGLTQDFNYSRVFEFYRELGRDQNIERLDLIREFSDTLLSLGVKATKEIYEYWIFFAIRDELIRLHFTPRSEEEALQMIQADVLTPCLKSGSSVTLVGEKQIYGDLTITLYYDKRYYSGGKEVARPDVTMEIRRGQQLYRFLFDAKYKDYTSTERLNSKARFWQEDLYQVSRRYQEMISDGKGAFLLHTNTHDEWLENFGTVVQEREGGPWKKNAHRYGFVPAVPGRLTSLRSLLVMIFLVKMQLDVDICWVCGSTDVRKETYQSQYSGAPKENHRICQKCGHEWWVNHCSCGFPLFKDKDDKLGFQIQHKKVQPKTTCSGYICPGCGKCACGATVEQIFNS